NGPRRRPSPATLSPSEREAVRRTCDSGAVSACCSPSNDRPSPTARPTESAATRPTPASPAGAAIDVALVALPAGAFTMGASPDEGYASDGEGPVHRVRLAPFAIAAATVTNDDFAAFCAATGYVTLAEREQWSFVFAGLLPDDFPPTRGVEGAPWWRQV